MTRLAKPPLATGMRNTRQRRLVWEAISRLGGHCTADEIAIEVRRREQGFPRSTVYRALEALTVSGAVRAVHLGDDATYYEISTEDHQHAVCSGCGCVLHLEHALVAELEAHLEESHRFKPERTDVLVVGLCDACQKGRRPKHAGRRTVGHVHF